MVFVAPLLIIKDWNELKDKCDSLDELIDKIKERHPYYGKNFIKETLISHRPIAKTYYNKEKNNWDSFDNYDDYKKDFELKLANQMSAH